MLRRGVRRRSHGRDARVTIPSLAENSLQSEIASVPPGAWAVGVSGGADSVALLSLLRARQDVLLTVAHLDHETRAGASTADAAFVRELSDAWRLPCVVGTLSSIEPQLPRRPNNLSERWRLARLWFFAQVVRARGLAGVILAHHADDQAETVLHRLLRGSGAAGLGGMKPSTTLSGVPVLRPLLNVRRDDLRAYLDSRGQPWREDVSNRSPRYARNRIRRLLAARPRLVGPLLELGTDCRMLTNVLDVQAPRLAERFYVSQVVGLPRPVARRALLRWLRDRSAQPVEPSSAERLLEMALDAASPARQHLPGGVLVQRRRGEIFTARH